MSDILEKAFSSETHQINSNDELEGKYKRAIHEMLDTITNVEVLKRIYTVVLYSQKRN